MRSRTPSSPKEEEDNPEPKRPKRDTAYDDGRESVKIPMPEHLQALSQLVNDCRAELVQAEAEARKAELQVFIMHSCPCVFTNYLGHCFTF